jgi:chorismate mutase
MFALRRQLFTVQVQQLGRRTGGVSVSEDPYYLIRRSHLPDIIRKTVEVTERLQQNPGLSVREAVEQVGISRSAYYKYKDVARPFFSAVAGHIVTIALTLRHLPGVLSEVLNLLARYRGNILTINQSLPLQGMATVILSVETREMSAPIDEVLEALRSLHGVQQVLVVGESETG